MTRILLLGPDGQVGWELQRSLAPLGTVDLLHRAEVDLQCTDMLRESVRQRAPDVIVNAAGYTAVDKAESEPGIAMSINGHAVQALAEEAEKSGALLVHYSTDYVFDGTKAGAYTEEDQPNPLSAYGKSKLWDERAIQATGCKHLIFRTSWIYGMHGSNFAKTLLRLAVQREDLEVVDDQVGAPTSAELLADITGLCIVLTTRWPSRYASGIYQVAPSGDTSWHGYATYMVEVAAELGVPLKLSPDRIKPVSSAHYGSPARRPLNSRLATDKLKALFGLELPHWKSPFRRFMAELMAAESR